MRKPVSIALALIFGIVAGLFSSRLWLRVHTLPYCTVAKNSEAYHEKYVRVRGRIFLAGNGAYMYNECDRLEALAATVDWDGDESVTEIKDAYGSRVSRETREVMVADAIVEGEFDAHYSPGCWGPKYHIAARRINLLSPPHKYEPPQTTSEAYP